MKGFRKRFMNDVDAVTPIIGTLLLITIMLTIISTILYWSIPTINRISWDTEFRTSMAGFEAYDAALEDTVTGGIAGSTRTVRISVAKGDMMYISNKARWYVSYTTSANYDFEIDGIDQEYESTRSITPFRVLIRPENTFEPDFDLELIWVNDTSTESQWFDDREFGQTLTPGRAFFGEQDTRYVRFRITRYDDRDHLMGEGYLIRLDRLEVRIPSEFGTARIISENGALIRSYNGHTVINSPILDYDQDSTKVLMNVIPMDVMGLRAVGPGNWRVRMRLADREYMPFDEAYHIRVRVFGENQVAWEEHLSRNFEAFQPAVDAPVSLTPGDEQDGFHLLAEGAVQLKLVRSTVEVDIEGV
ncbi:MAG: hypothetical protein L0Z54_05795 [Thermoplasmata archaeon]|nr:hypothetical protein [Thermoplasmata archaeon]